MNASLRNAGGSRIALAAAFCFFGLFLSLPAHALAWNCTVIYSGTSRADFPVVVEADGHFGAMRRALRAAPPMAKSQTQRRVPICTAVSNSGAS